MSGVNGTVTQDLLTLREAADLAGKSEQTIRRMIKSGRLTPHKQQTQTGFNYLVNRYEVAQLFGTDSSDSESAVGTATVSEPAPAPPVEPATTQSTQDPDRQPNHESASQPSQSDGGGDVPSSPATPPPDVASFWQNQVDRLQTELETTRAKGEERQNQLVDELMRLKAEAGHAQGRAEALAQVKAELLQISLRLSGENRQLLETNQVLQTEKERLEEQLRSRAEDDEEGVVTVVRTSAESAIPPQPVRPERGRWLALTFALITLLTMGGLAYAVGTGLIP